MATVPERDPLNTILPVNVKIVAWILADAPWCWRRTCMVRLPTNGGYGALMWAKPWSVTSAWHTAACELMLTIWFGASPHLIPAPGWLPDNMPFCTPSCAVGPSVEQNDSLTPSPSPISPTPGLGHPRAKPFL